MADERAIRQSFAGFHEDDIHQDLPYLKLPVHLITAERGDVVRVVGDKVVVSNINIIKRHTKPNPQAGQAGGVVEREAPIHASNVMPFNPATGKGERISVSFNYR